MRKRELTIYVICNSSLINHYYIRLLQASLIYFCYSSKGQRKEITVNNIKNKSSGFTLVELAIVLMIIGLLIGGILRGQEMIRQARLQNIIKQITSYEAAMATFVDTYSNYPGDMAIATTKIPGCTTANSCLNGNGDSKIGVGIDPWESGPLGTNTENSQFWKHLALSHLITGVDPSYNSTTMVQGKSNPAASYGGFSIITTGANGACAGYTGSIGYCKAGSFVLRLHGDPNGVQVELVPVLSPHQLAYIDRKMDDGIPSTGNVTSGALGAGGGCEGNSYDERSEVVECVMYYLMK